ncbi:MAG: hypothetical protein HUK20_11965 [Fibrobacter sp.]|nr:hypothetical protein [Fibrobacter sp.]
MIHLDLIEAADRLSTVDTVSPVNLTSVADLRRQSRKKVLAAFLCLLLAFAGFNGFLIVFGIPVNLQGSLPEPYLDFIGVKDPSRAGLVKGVAQTTSAGGTFEAHANMEAELKQKRDAMTVKQLVSEISPNSLFNNKRTDYTSFLPLEKLAYQKASLGQFIAFLNTATPDDVGFTDCVYQIPNFYYVRGVSANPASQRSFIDRIKAVTTDFRTPPLPENAPATDITVYGQFNVNGVNLGVYNKFVTSAELTSELKSMKTMATANKVSLSGLEKPIVEDFGVYKRYTYKVSTPADFSDLQAFFAAYTASTIRIGVQSVTMKTSKKDLATSINFEMFVVP